MPFKDLPEGQTHFDSEAERLAREEENWKEKIWKKILKDIKYNGSKADIGTEEEARNIFKNSVLNFIEKVKKESYSNGYKDGLNEKDTSCDAAFKLLKGKASHDPIDRIMDKL